MAMAAGSQHRDREGRIVNQDAKSGAGTGTPDSPGRKLSITHLEFPTLVPAPVEDVWRVTTDFDFVVYLMKPWYTITYDRDKAGNQLANKWSKDTTWKLFGFIPYGTYREDIIEWQPNAKFVDTISGPFKFWRHTHLYEPRGQETLYTDSIEIDPGWMGPMAVWLTRLLWIPRRRKLRRYFEKRRSR